MLILFPLRLTPHPYSQFLLLQYQVVEIVGKAETHIVVRIRTVIVQIPRTAARVRTIVPVPKTNRGCNVAANITS